MVKQVVLADSQFLTRNGMIALMRSIPGIELVKEVENVHSLKPIVDDLQPDLIVVDFNGRDNDLLGQIEQIAEIHAHVTFLVISSIHNKESIQKLLAAGVKGILTKSCSEEEITNGLIAVSKGNRFFCNTILELVIQSETEVENCEPTNLSVREYEVLTLITKGMTTAMIAGELNLSIHTINSHRKNILKKLGLSSPTELVVYALESGLVKK